MDGLGCDCRCQTEWRQIGRCGQANFGNSSEDADAGGRDPPPETLSAIAYGEKVLTALDWAIRKTQFLTLLPQLYPLLIRINLNMDVDAVSGSASPKDERLQGQFLRDLHVLLTWPCSKKGVVTGDEENALKPIADERRPDNLPEMCYFPPKPHKNLATFLKGDKSLRNFFRQLLATPIITNVSESHTVSQPAVKSPKPSMIKLLKMGLRSRYSSHIRKAIKEFDSQSVQCILSIVVNSEMPVEVQPSCDDMDANLKGTITTASLQEEFAMPFANLDDDVLKDSDATITTFSEESYEQQKNSDAESKTGWVEDQDDTTLLSLSNLFSGDGNSAERVRVETTSNICKLKEDVSAEKEFPFHLRQTDAHVFTQALQRVFNILQIRFSSMSQIMNQNIDDLEKHNHDLSIGSMHKFLLELKRLRNLMAFTRLKSQTNFPLSKRIHEEQRISKLSQHHVDLSNKTKNLEKMLHQKREKHELILTKMNTEIADFEEKLENTLVENEILVIETVKKLETECKIEEKHHEKRLMALEKRVDKVEMKLTESIYTLDFGHKGLRAYRKKKESELRQLIHDNNEMLTQHKEVLHQLIKLEKSSNEEIRRLQELLLGMQDQYEEMKNTKRLKELLQNLQMAEAVRENWAARRIQAAWKRYKVRKLRKRRIKKPKKKRKEVQVSTQPDKEKNAKGKIVQQKPIARKQSKVLNSSNVKKLK